VKLALFATLILICLGACGKESEGKAQPSKLSHAWPFVNFDNEKGAPTFLLISDYDHPDLHEFRLDIHDIPQGFSYFKSNTITARLYRANGQIVELGRTPPATTNIVVV
jgi:hypothetical protein